MVDRPILVCGNEPRLVLDDNATLVWFHLVNPLEANYSMHGLRED
jgi:hypothetical protein